MPAPTLAVSVIIPTYNRAHCILAAIESALAQTGLSLEVLVCDDGSRDDTQRSVEALADPRVRFLAGVHSGRPAVVRNRGIAASQGDWLAFLDSDDTWLPNKLATQLSLVHSLGCLAACGNAVRVVPGLGAQGNLLAFAEPRLSFARLVRGNLVICSSAMFHRSLLGRVGGFPEQASVVAAEDYALWLKVATLTDFAFVREPLLHYRDAPADSIRGVDQAAEQRRARAVFADYLAWAPPLERAALTLRWELARRSFHALQERWRGRGDVSRP